MDHHDIEEQNIPDRYLQGKLSPAERVRFEEHLIDCAECLDRLETTEDFRTGLRTVAAEDAAAARVYARPGLRAWWMGLAGARQAALLAAAVLVLVALPAAVVITEIQSRRQVDQARQSAADWQRRYEAGQQAARNAETEMQAREQELSRQRLELEAQREPGRQARATAPIFDLNTVRSGNPAAPGTRISIPRAARWIVLKLEVEPDPERQSYRATLFASDRQAICRASDVTAVNEALVISCDASLFKPGDYRLTLEGLTRQGQYVPAGTYAFHVIRQ
jgi:putative zinc finger protein